MNELTPEEKDILRALIMRAGSECMLDMQRYSCMSGVHDAAYAQAVKLADILGKL